MINKLCTLKTKEKAQTLDVSTEETPRPSFTHRSQAGPRPPGMQAAANFFKSDTLLGFFNTLETEAKTG